MSGVPGHIEYGPPVTALGGTLVLTMVTGHCAIAVTPRESVTVTFAARVVGKVPGLVYACEVETPDPAADASPKSHAYETIDTSGSGWNDAEASKATVPPCVPMVAGVAEHAATGGRSNSEGDRMITPQDEAMSVLIGAVPVVCVKAPSAL